MTIKNEDGFFWKIFSLIVPALLSMIFIVSVIFLPVSEEKNNCLDDMASNFCLTKNMTYINNSQHYVVGADKISFSCTEIDDRKIHLKIEQYYFTRSEEDYCKK